MTDTLLCPVLKRLRGGTSFGYSFFNIPCAVRLTKNQDDLWRRNRETIAALRTHEEDFNPHFATSIAYTPLPRAALESFLAQRGLLHKKPKYFDCFHSGFLNKLYIRLNDCVYRDSHRVYFPKLVKLGFGG
jgi:hypothetical protein